MKGTSMKAYLVWCDNGESYEDGFRYVDSVFSSWDGAARYLDDKGFERKESRYYDSGSKKMVDSVEWVPSLCKCAMGLTECKADKCNKFTAWVESDYADDVIPCEDYESLYDNDYRSYWFIEEHEMND